MLRVILKKGVNNYKYYTIRNIHVNSTENVLPFRRKILSPIIFGTSGCCGIFITAAFIHEKERTVFWKRIRQNKHSPTWSKLCKIITNDKFFNLEIWKVRKKLLLDKKEQLLQKIKQAFENYQAIPRKIKRAALYIAQVALTMSDAEKTISALIALNLILFGIWQIPRMQPFMNRYFIHNPLSGRYITLITSCLSQRQISHLLLITVGLWSIGPWLYDGLGREQFVALYLSLGIGSNTISHITQIALYQRYRVTHSHGAIGAVYGLISSTAASHPDSTIFIPFTTWIPIKISYTMMGLICFDFIGILLRWHLFNHFTHLGGIALGTCYMQYGPDIIWLNLLKKVNKIQDQFGKEGGNADGGDDNSGVLMEIPKKIRIKLLGKIVPDEQ